ncbi:MAG TPA: RtcB family protein [Aggregatilineales bacterium]|nr:RtcB family protein [Aggregatilineales bacterium]
MNGNDILRIGYKQGKVIRVALNAAREYREIHHASKEGALNALADVLNAPENYRTDPIFGPVVLALLEEDRKESTYDLTKAAPYQVWGAMNIEPAALEQMRRAVNLPIAVRGAMMPDAHVGYGLPVGGVLATHNSVIPYAVGVDIACRMRLTVFDAAPYVLEQKRDKFRHSLEKNTRFGVGVTWDPPIEHEVMDDPLWQMHPVARQNKDRARVQLGTSGSGNHFVEFGSLVTASTIVTPSGTIPPGKYLALLSHSGSRRLGMEIADFYTEVAMQQRAKLPKEYLHLAWLDLDQEAGAEYWAGMTLAGRYASANHAIIHALITDALRLDVLGEIENHHNFAWKETFDGEEVIVHRKGATPAADGVLGVIPGSMAAPGYVVRGLGNAASLDSAAHGAGRKMSRGEAIKRFDWATLNRKLKAQGVEVLSAGLDEAPGAYKDIQQVMSDQADLVERLAEFWPMLVKMDRGSERQRGGDRDA